MATVPSSKWGWKGILLFAGKILLWLALAWFTFYFIRVLRSVNWRAVGDSLIDLAWWQLGILLILALLRVVLNSVPLALLVSGLGIRKAVANDLTGELVALVTPPPADIVARGSLFRRWGIPLTSGIAGLVMNSVLFYVVRFVVPLVGAIIISRFTVSEGAVGWAAITVGLLGIGLVVLLTVLSSQPHLTAGAARKLAATGLKVRPNGPEPEAFAARVSEFQSEVSGRWLRFWPHSTAAFALMVTVEAGIVLAAIRFSGVSAAQASLGIVVGAFLTFYILKAAPMQGLGVFDGAVVALIVELAPEAEAAQLVAALIVWRICVQLLPMILGVIPTLLLSAASGAETQPAELQAAEATDGEPGLETAAAATDGEPDLETAAEPD